MVLFTSEGSLKKYHFVENIINEFCEKRMTLYNVRYKGELKKMEEELKYINNKIRFLTEINADKNKLIIKDKEIKDIEIELDTRKYDRKLNKKSKIIKNNIDEEGDDNEEEKEIDDDEIEERASGTYRYLLDMKIIGASKTKMNKLILEKEKLEEKIELYKKKTPKGIWLHELDEVENEYKKWLLNADDDRESNEKIDVETKKPKKKKI